VTPGRRPILAAASIAGAAALAVAGCALHGSRTAAVQPLGGAPPADAPVRVAGFAFHNGFWMNLHHAVYGEAYEERHPPKDAPPFKGLGEACSGLSEEDAARWRASVAWYAGHYASRDLLFDDGLYEIKEFLASAENTPVLQAPHADTGTAVSSPKPGEATPLPDEGTVAALNAAAKAYATCRWPDDRHANRRWIVSLTGPLAQHGEEVKRKLVSIYRAPWPEEEYRVDVTGYASWSGAYTSTHPAHSVISGSDPGNQGLTGYEILFHEASHTLIGPSRGEIMKKVSDACRARGKLLPRDLWHIILFYSTGEVIREQYQRRGLGPYVPFADAGGLYDRVSGWEAMHRAVSLSFKPWIDGAVDLDTAVSHLVEALPDAPSK